MATQQNATSKNTNLFYQLYSTPSKIVQSGFVCSNAIDESATSFDISDNAGEITDSNGDVLTSIDLSDIHADELTEYYSETKIIGGNSAFLLQGNCSGETYASQFFRLPDEIQNVEDYEPFINIMFDIHWSDCDEMTAININTEKVRTEPESVCDLIQKELDRNGIPVSVSVQNLEMCSSCRSKSCSLCRKMSDYLVFMSQVEGFTFFVHNVYVMAVGSDYENEDGTWSDYTDSPFIGANITFDYILDLIRKFAPGLACDCCDAPDYTDVPCDIYKFMITIAPLAINDRPAFNYNINGLREFSKYFNENGECINERGFMNACAMYSDLYAYYFGVNLGILNKYNIHDILKMLASVSTYVHSSNVSGPYKMEEDYNRRTNPVKYPNGAMRGIVIIPQWPDDGDYAAIRIAHVSDSILVDEKVELGPGYRISGLSVKDSSELFRKVRATVKINTLLQSEYEVYNKNLCNMPLKKVISNDSLKQSTDSKWTSDLHEPLSNGSKWCTSMDWHDVSGNIWSTSGEYQDIYNPETKGYEYKEPEHDIYKIREDYVNEYTVPHKYDILGRIPGRTVTDEIINKENVIGLYGYMQYLNENELWTKVGECYMVIGKKDNYQSNERNLLNSVLIYNPNNIPLRVKTLVFS